MLKAKLDEYYHYFSPIQQRTRNGIDENLLVSASAGSGKTTAMIAKIVTTILLHGASLDNMLVCTFTKKSALDMKEKLYKDLTCFKKAGIKEAEIQLDLLGQADICTIDSWCQKIVSTYFFIILFNRRLKSLTDPDVLHSFIDKMLC